MTFPDPSILRVSGQLYRMATTWSRVRRRYRQEVIASALAVGG